MRKWVEPDSGGVSTHSDVQGAAFYFILFFGHACGVRDLSSSTKD